MTRKVTAVRTIGLAISVETQNALHAPSRNAAFEYHLKDGAWNLESAFDLGALTRPAGNRTPDWLRAVIETGAPHSIVGDTTEIAVTLSPTERESRMLGQYTPGFRTHPGGVRLLRTSSVFDPTKVTTTVVVLDTEGSAAGEFLIRPGQYEDLVRKLQAAIPTMPCARPALAVL